MIIDGRHENARQYQSPPATTADVDQDSVFNLDSNEDEELSKLNTAELQLN